MKTKKKCSCFVFQQGLLVCGLQQFHWKQPQLTVDWLVSAAEQKQANLQPEHMMNTLGFTTQAWHHCAASVPVRASLPNSDLNIWIYCRNQNKPCPFVRFSLPRSILNMFHCWFFVCFFYLNLRIEHFNTSYILVCSKVHFYRKSSEYICKRCHVVSKSYKGKKWLWRLLAELLRII